MHRSLSFRALRPLHQGLSALLLTALAACTAGGAGSADEPEEATAESESALGFAGGVGSVFPIPTDVLIRCRTIDEVHREVLIAGAIDVGMRYADRTTRDGHAYRPFERALIVQKAGGCAFEMHGDIYEKWKEFGPLEPSTLWVAGRAVTMRNTLGLPTSDERSAGPRGRTNSFERGAIFFSDATGAHEVHGEILKAYRARSAATGWLGLPVSDTEPYGAAGRLQGNLVRFENGTIVTDQNIDDASAQPRAVALRKPIADRWFAVRSRAGRELEFPIEDTVVRESGMQNDFMTPSRTYGGSIYFSEETGARALWTAVRSKYEELGATTSILGYPAMDTALTPLHKSPYAHFAGGASIYVNPASGRAFYATGTLRAKWEATGFEQGILGFPQGDPVLASAGGRYQAFDKGYLYEVPGGSRASAVLHAWDMLKAYWNAGGERGALGYPIEDAVACTERRSYQNFQGGYIWSLDTHGDGRLYQTRFVPGERGGCSTMGDICTPKAFEVCLVHRESTSAIAHGETRTIEACSIEDAVRRAQDIPRSVPNATVATGACRAPSWDIEAGCGMRGRACCRFKPTACQNEKWDALTCISGECEGPRRCDPFVSCAFDL
jgi:hypothetical protein